MTTACASSVEPSVAAVVRLETEGANDRQRVERLIDEAFGPGRFAKTAERLREGAPLRPELSICAWVDGEMVGAVRQWTIRIGETDAIFLGPIAVRADHRRTGFGGALIGRACDAALSAGERLILLVGDTPFFGPLGFQAVERGRVLMPGPVDPARLLWRALEAGALDGVAGAVRIRGRR